MFVLIEFIEVNTPDALEYHWYPFNNGVVNFKVRAPNDAHLALTGGPHDGEPIIEIFLGGWGNSKSVIRRNKTKPEKAENSTPNILSAGEFRGFWVRVQDGVSSILVFRLETTLIPFSQVIERLPKSAHIFQNQPKLSKISQQKTGCQHMSFF